MGMTATAGRELAKRTRRVIGLQVVLGGLTAAGFVFLSSSWDGLSALFGATISVASAWWLSRGVASASNSASQGGRGEAVLYISAALRFLMVLALFALGLLLLKLNALATVSGFVVAQLAFIGGASMRGLQNKETGE